MSLAVCLSVCLCRQGTLKVGDRILKINGVDVHEATQAEALALLRACNNQLTLEIEFDVTVHGMGMGIGLTMWEWERVDSTYGMKAMSDDSTGHCLCQSALTCGPLPSLPPFLPPLAVQRSCLQPPDRC